MNYVIAVLLPFFYGYKILSAYKNRSLFSVFDYLLMYVIGIWVCAILVLINLMVFNGFEPGYLWVMHVLACVLMVLFSRPSRRSFGCISTSTLLFWLLGSFPLMIFLVWLGENNPFGDWDSWSFWNMRAKFFYLAHERWYEIFDRVLQAKHPLLLTNWVLHGWGLIGQETAQWARHSTYIFFILVNGLLFFALKFFNVRSIYAMFAVYVMFFIPYFVIHTVSQYADILMAFFILANVVNYHRFIQTPSLDGVKIAAFILGVSTFVKDEGILLGFWFLFVWVLLLARRYRGWLVSFLTTLLIVSLPTFLVKIWMINAPLGVNSTNISFIFDLSRYSTVLNYYFLAWQEPFYGGFIALIGILAIVVYLTRHVNISSVGELTIITYLSAICLLYVIVDNNLEWRLWTTAYRVTFQLMPLVVFLIFFRLFGSVSVTNKDR